MIIKKILNKIKSYLLRGIVEKLCVDGFNNGKRKIIKRYLLV